MSTVRHRTGTIPQSSSTGRQVDDSEAIDFSKRFPKFIPISFSHVKGKIPMVVQCLLIWFVLIVCIWILIGVFNIDVVHFIQHYIPSSSFSSSSSSIDDNKDIYSNVHHPIVDNNNNNNNNDNDDKTRIIIKKKSFSFPSLQLQPNPLDNKQFFHNYPEPYIMKNIAHKYDRVVAIGDLHGDLEQLYKILHLSGIIDIKTHEWIANNTILIQTGDIFDRGKSSVEILEYFWNLRHQIQTDPNLAQSNLILHVLGNHEHLNLIGKYYYVSPLEMYKHGTASDWKKKFETSHNMGYFLRHTPIARIVEKSLFVHAGIHPDVCTHFEGNISRMNEFFKWSLTRKDFTSNEVYLLTGDNGPIWTRYFESKFYTEDMVSRIDFSSSEKSPKKKRKKNQHLSNEEYMCKLVEETTKKLQVNRMIIGHNPQSDGKVRIRCQGRLISIDVGMSEYYGGNLGALEIDLKNDRIKIIQP